MLAERATDLREREVLRIVAGQSKPVPRRETRDCGGNGSPHQREESRPLRVGRVRFGGNRVGILFGRQRVEQACAPHAVHVPLSQHGAQPRREAAPSVEVAKERQPFAVPLPQPEQVRVQRVREVARAARAVDRIGRAVEHRPVLAHEMLPRPFVSLRARACKRKVFEVE